MKCHDCAKVGVAGLHCQHCGTDHDIWALEIGVRPTTVLRNRSIRTVAQLLEFIEREGDQELLLVPNSGEVTRSTVMKQLAYFGFVEKVTQKVRVQKHVVVWRTVTETSYRVIRTPAVAVGAP